METKQNKSEFQSLQTLGLTRFLQLSSCCNVIPLNAFTSCCRLEKLHIPEGVEVIGRDAFAICTALKEVYLPSTLKKIDRGVFWRCVSLKSIAILASVEEIGEYVFYDCNSYIAMLHTHVVCRQYSTEPVLRYMFHAVPRKVTVMLITGILRMWLVIFSKYPVAAYCKRLSRFQRGSARRGREMENRAKFIPLSR